MESKTNGAVVVELYPSGQLGGDADLINSIALDSGTVDIIITDQGIADLRHKDPVERAHEIINNCAHPMYRPLLNDYLKLGAQGQTPHTLNAAFAFHNAFSETGDMRNADYAKYC